MEQPLTPPLPPGHPLVFVIFIDILNIFKAGFFILWGVVLYLFSCDINDEIYR